MQGHAYDKAKSGYVNLLIGSSTKSHGDDEAMVLSRTRFLSQGFYDPLKNRLIELIKDLKVSSLVDLGCGEGNYTNAIQEALSVPVIGIDLSKAALKIASKSNKKVDYVLANITKTPLSDQDTDAVLSVFSPIDLNEVGRICKRFLILVRPNPDHLLELKQALYTKVLKNPVPDTNLSQLKCILEEECSFTMVLDQDSICDLLDMTPYVHTSSKEAVIKVKSLSHLNVTAQFHISIYQVLHETSA